MYIFVVPSLGIFEAKGLSEYISEEKVNVVVLLLSVLILDSGIGYCSS